jgi:serine protease
MTATGAMLTRPIPAMALRRVICCARPAAPTGREASFHGTHVAGTVGVGLTNNGVGVAGGNWRVSVSSIRALGRCGGAISDIADAILWAANLHDPRFGLPVNPRPAAVINMSLGGGARCALMPILQDAISRARAAGVVVVVAAGNEGRDAANALPASCNGVITVAASDARGVLTPYQNFGATVEILAPGGDTRRDDNGDGFPDGILSTRTAPCAPSAPAEQCKYSFFQGTSMAMPHVAAAAAALLIAHEPSINAGPINERSDRVLAWLKRNALSRASAQCPQPCGGALLNLEERVP